MPSQTSTHPAPLLPAHDQTPDDDLMHAYVQGEAGAFDALYARHESALYRFIKRLLGLRLAPEVDEVFQETWQQIISERQGFSLESAGWRAWAFAVAHNLAMERLRLSGRDTGFYAHDHEGDGLDAALLFSRGLFNEGGVAADPQLAAEEENAFWTAAGKRLLACLEELSDDQRATFLLIEEGFALPTIALTLGVAEDTVGARWRQAHRKLRQCMERYLAVLAVRP